MHLLSAFGRILARAALFSAFRRSPRAIAIAAAIVGLALMSIGTARAQVPPALTNSPTITQAYAKCRAYVDYIAAQPGTNRTNPQCYDWPQDSYVYGCFDIDGVQNCNGAGTHSYQQGCPANAPWDPSSGTCKQPCTSRADITVTRPPFAPAGLGSPSNFGQCSGGCYVSFTNMQDGTYVGVHTSNAQCDTPGLPNTETCEAVGRVSGPWGCQQPAQECAANQVRDPVTGECKGSICPAGMILTTTGECANEGNTCPPGQIKSPAGGCLAAEGTCAAGEARGKDGTCKRDANNDGIPDHEQGEPDGGDDGSAFSGGDGCNNPPSCSGSPILCGQARIQWRIECNTRRKVNMAGGTCGAMPMCIGENCDAMEHAQLIQQWRTACTLEKIAQGSGAIVPGDGNGEDGPPVLWDSTGEAAAIVDATAGQGDPGDAFTDGTQNPTTPGSDGELDTTGFGYGSSCPQLPVVNVFGTSVDFNVAAPDMCRWFRLAGQIVLVLAALMSVRIISAGGSV